MSSPYKNKTNSYDFAFIPNSKPTQLKTNKSTSDNELIKSLLPYTKIVLLFMILAICPIVPFELVGVPHWLAQFKWYTTKNKAVCVMYIIMHLKAVRRYNYRNNVPYIKNATKIHM